MSIESNLQNESFDQVDELPRDIRELVEAIERLPQEFRQQLNPSMEKAVAGIKRRRRILQLVQDALAQLRLDMKYLVFDLEATRRERDTFRQQLNGE